MCGGGGGGREKQEEEGERGACRGRLGCLHCEPHCRRTSTCSAPLAPAALPCPSASVPRGASRGVAVNSCIESLSAEALAAAIIGGERPGMVGGERGVTAPTASLAPESEESAGSKAATAGGVVAFLIRGVTLHRNSSGAGRTRNVRA